MRDVDLAFQLNCPEMSLASGLDLLKDMRVLDVSRMAHRIGVPGKLENLDLSRYSWACSKIDLAER